MDEKDYSIIEVIAQMFTEDNPTLDKVKFRHAVDDARSKKSSSSNGG